MQMEQYILNWIIIFFLIIILTFFQKYYYKFLYYLKQFFWLKYIIDFIIRSWVILHEFSHIFFSFLATFIWSTINFIIFLWFISIFSLIFNYFIIFCISFLLWFNLIFNKKSSKINHYLPFFIFLLNLEFIPE